MTYKTIKLLLLMTMAAGTLFGCWEIDPVFQADFPAGKVNGYKPQYGSKAQTEVVLLGKQTLQQPGKIYIYHQFLLVNEFQKGIHVYNNADPSNPEALSFISLLGNTDMAIKDDILYADHNGDLKAIRLNGFNNLLVLDSIPLTEWHYGVAPPAGFYFECVDATKGVVVGWQNVELTDPNCYAIN